MTLQQTTSTVFQEKFGSSATHFFRAPGRVNLIGEHTDYNDGFVLPCAINYETVIAVRPRTDSLVTLVAADYDNQTSQFDLTADIKPDPRARWSDYIRGVVSVLQQQGHALTGFDLVVSGNVPHGAGLSSSASLEVVVGTALSELNQLGLDGKQVALIGQQAENEFVGMRCGIMDQFISALGQADHALLIDCRDLSYQSVSMPSGTSLVIVNSHAKRGELGSLVDSEYNVRREQCEAAAQFFGVPALRDVTLAEFEQRQAELDPLIARRARHVISENERTVTATTALAQGNIQHMGRLMAESHASMRDDFEITVPPVDTLVEIIKTVIGENGGVRMTGGGFGGCVVSLVPSEAVSEVVQQVEKQYPTQTNLTPTIYVCHASAGAGELQLHDLSEVHYKGSI
ncbi:galactokinase [Anaerolineales bacterium HSG6]|nr:galactokinase [Anaerolineales bacterium HSG6]